LSLLIGGASAFAVSVLTILWAVFVMGRAAPSRLLAGGTTDDAPRVSHRPSVSCWLAGVSFALALLLTAGGWFVPDGENRAMTFFGAGALMLTACLAAAWAWMRGRSRRNAEGRGWWGVARLGVRNAGRHPVRSLLTAGLLASAAFLIVAVEAFRRHADAAMGGKDSPSGGFALVAESDLPVFQDLNSDKGREEIGDKLRAYFRKKTDGDEKEAQRRTDDALDLLKQTTIYSLRVHSGDDASCLNLYEPKRPRLLGAPKALIDRGGFTFAETATTEGDPWMLLNRPDQPYAAFGEQNTVVWVLGKGLGADDLTVEGAVPDKDGKPPRLRIDGLLQDSVFQSGLLLSEDNFLRLYPGHEGYNFFLIKTPPGQEDEVRMLLNAALADRGFEAVPTAQRLQSFLAVENTYLSTFQALGGLGLILGSLGLAVVLLRGVWERRGELALLRALGFRRSSLSWLVLAENGFLLLLGLAAGAASAAVAAAPHLLRHGGETPWLRLIGLLLATAAVGLVVAAMAAAAALRAPLIAALRRE
jgi:putative ABC transport system permease protein